MLLEIKRHVECNGVFKDVEIHRMRTHLFKNEMRDRTNGNLHLKVPGYPKINWDYLSLCFTEDQQHYERMTVDEREKLARKHNIVL